MRILIVDDSKAMRFIVMRTLRKAGFGDHTFEEAANGKEALDAIKQSPPDVLLTDWAMPEMNGIQLLEAIQASGIKLRSGMVTSQGTPEMKQRAQQAGASFLLSKPFTADSIRAALAPVLAA